MVMKMRNMMKRENGQKGFTLIELIVVMAILAILAAIAIPKYSAILQQSKFKANDSNVDMIAHAAEMYYNGSTPSTVPSTISALTSAGYLKTVPSNPTGGSAYGLTNSGSGVAISPGKYGTGSTASTYNYAF